MYVPFVPSMYSMLQIFKIKQYICCKYLFYLLQYYEARFVVLKVFFILIYMFQKHERAILNDLLNWGGYFDVDIKAVSHNRIRIDF